jgi:hypothetical protein
MIYQNESFQNERIELSGNAYHGCRFENCELVYRGDRSPTFQDNEFIDSVFVFTDAAIRTIYFLSNMYHAGAGGREVVDNTFEDIRRGAIHGRFARTAPPHTVDHSLGGT